MSTPQKSLFGGHELLLMFIAFFGIFVYGLLAALPGTVLATLERNQYLPNDSKAGTFLLINAIGAVLAYLLSGPIIDRLGKKFALLCGSALVIASMVGFAVTVTKVQATAALPLIFACSLVLGMGANAIVASGHALVVDIAPAWRNAALNLLDICFGLGLAALPLVTQRLQQEGGLGLIFWTLAGVSLVLFVLVLARRFPVPIHHGSSSAGGVASLFRNPSFLLLALALFMYVGSEVSVGKWVVAFMQRDERILASQGVNATQLQELARVSPEALSKFFETDPLGVAVAGYSFRTLTLFAIALLMGRLVSSFLLAILRVNSFRLITVGSLLTTVALTIGLTSSTAGTVRLGLIAAGFGMGPIFPTSVGLASVMMPKIAGTAMSLVMGIGFAGLLVIPPAVGYVSSAMGGDAGNLRAGLVAIIVASVLMLALHIMLTVRERRRSSLPEDSLERDAVAATK